MVSRVSLIFWRWVVVLHDRLHDARDKATDEAFQNKYRQSDAFTSTVKGANVTYTSPSVHYLGRNRTGGD